MVRCPSCGRENAHPVKTWFRGTKAEPEKMKIDRYICSCGASFVSWVDGETGKLTVMKR
jgi:hypothetical protein